MFCFLWFTSIAFFSLQKAPKTSTFKVEIDCDDFKVPEKIVVPQKGDRSQSAPAGKGVYVGK